MLKGRLAAVLILGAGLALATTACKGSGDTTEPANTDAGADAGVNADAGGDVDADPEAEAEADAGAEEPAGDASAADEVAPDEAEVADNECRQTCKDEGKEDTDLATCRLNCLAEKGVKTESPGVMAARSYMLCADSCAHGGDVDLDNDECRDTCRAATLDESFPNEDDAAKRECANGCFDAGFSCGARCIEHGSKTDDDDPCQRVCIADARTCFDGCVAG